MARAFEAEDRQVLRIGGADRRKFLQDLVTNNLDRIGQGAVYAALLTPQGKYLADFFLVSDGDTILMDADAAQVDDLVKRMTMYKLRADVTIAPLRLRVVQGWGEGPPPEGAVTDPRDPALGWRVYTESPETLLAAYDTADPAEWHALRIARGVPQSGIELIPNDTFILEAGLERLNGVDFRKGCFVGQEVTARMRHKTELRKGLVQVHVIGSPPPPGTAVEAGGKTVGTLYSCTDGIGLAHLRYDRAGGEMTAGDAQVRWDGAEEAASPP